MAKAQKGPTLQRLTIGIIEIWSIGGCALTFREEEEREESFYGDVPWLEAGPDGSAGRCGVEAGESARSSVTPPCTLLYPPIGLGHPPIPSDFIVLKIGGLKRAFLAVFGLNDRVRGRSV